MIYRSLLKRTWQLTWRYWPLWLLGIAITPLSIGGEYRPLLRLLGIGLSAPTGTATSFFSRVFLTDWLYQGSAIVKSIFSQAPIAATLWTLFIIAVFVLLAWLIFACQGALIASIDKLNRHQTVKLSEVVAGGAQHGWNIFLVNLIGKLVILAIVLLVGLPLLVLYITQTGNTGSLPVVSGSAFLLLAIVLYIPLAVVVSFVTTLALNYLVIMGDGVIVSFRHAIRLFRRHWAECLEWAAIMLGINFLVYLALYLVVSVFLSPLSGLGFALANIGLPWAVTLALLAALAWLFVIAFLAVFQTTAWVLLFEQLTVISPGQIVSKIYRSVKTIF